MLLAVKESATAELRPVQLQSAVSVGLMLSDGLENTSNVQGITVIFILFSRQSDIKAGEDQRIGSHSGRFTV